MALAMQPNMATQDDIMDIDIDMDIDDVGPVMEDDMLEEGEEPSFQHQHHDPSGIIPAIYTEDPATEPQWQKVHVRGVDDMHTNDILAFSKDNFPDADPHVQWIDDTSANLVFQDKETARQAIVAFSVTPVDADQIQNNPFEFRQAKRLASRPASILTVRIAQAGDRKRKNARDASRYYLLHPDEDPSEKTRREFANSRPSRGENGDYKRRRFDDREHRRRKDHDRNAETEDFSAAMYDDAPAPDAATEGARGRDLFSRTTKGRRRSASPNAQLGSDASDDDRPRRRRNGYRDRSNPPPYSRRDPNPHPRTNIGKELFSSDPVKRPTGLQSDLFSSTASSAAPRALTTEQRQTNSAAARRLKADLLASVLPQAQSPRASQTSPRAGGGNGHRRSHAMDAKNDEDLAERFGRKSMSMDSTKSINAKTVNTGIELFPSDGNGGLNIRGAAGNGQGMSIKGSANISSNSGTGFSIKGRAGAEPVKELFPSGAGNKGKELFDQPVRRKIGRQRAGDLFD